MWFGGSNEELQKIKLFFFETIKELRFITVFIYFDEGDLSDS